MLMDNKVQDMTPGEALLEAPIGEFIQRIASSIAESQLKLDQIGVRVASLLSETKVPFSKPDGGTVERSLLELGFLPPFYTFTQTDIEVKMTIALKVEEDLTIEGEASIGDVGGGAGTAAEQAKRVVPFGASISAEYHRKYEFDMTGASTVKTHLVSIPAPSVFLEAIKEQARLGGRVGKAGSGGLARTPSASGEGEGEPSTGGNESDAVASGDSPASDTDTSTDPGSDAGAPGPGSDTTPAPAGP